MIRGRSLFIVSQNGCEECKQKLKIAYPLKLFVFESGVGQIQKILTKTSLQIIEILIRM